jgi:hypothetical protein
MSICIRDILNGLGLLSQESEEKKQFVFSMLAMEEDRMRRLAFKCPLRAALQNLMKEGE